MNAKPVPETKPDVSVRMTHKEAVAIHTFIGYSSVSRRKVCCSRLFDDEPIRELYSAISSVFDDE